MGIIILLLIGCLNGLFTWFFDIDFTGIGLIYVYFTMLFFTLVIYLFQTWLRVNWFGTFSFGLCGLIGIPIEWWLEFKLSGALKSVWGAVGWGVIFLLYGLAADISFHFLKPDKNEARAVLLSSMIFSLALILLTNIPLCTFYKTSIIGYTSVEFLQVTNNTIDYNWTPSPNDTFILAPGEGYEDTFELSIENGEQMSIVY